MHALEQEVSIRLPVELLKQIDVLVKKHPGIWDSRSQLIRSGVFWFIKQRSGKIIAAFDGEVR